jgi:hypothetical protein
MKRLLALALLITSTAYAQAATVTASATLTWPAVASATSGAALTPPVTYNVWGSVVAAGGACATSTMKQLASALTALTYTSNQSGLTPGSLMCFAATATASGVTGAFSNVVSVVVPSAPVLTPGSPAQITATIVFVSSP